MEIEKKVIDELAFLQFKMPDYVLNAVKSEVEEMKAKKFEGALPYNYSLAGTIEHEYALLKSASAINDFFSHDRFFFNGRRLKLLYKNLPNTDKRIPALWVNFQQKYEYNPIHNHDGVVSFVLWLNIPYDLKDEINLPHVRSGTAPAGPAFIFLYSPLSKSSIPVDFYRIDVDKSYEGTCVLFKSNLQHMVTPFYTSDDFRISVSGNVSVIQTDIKPII